MKERIIKALLSSEHNDGDRLPSVRTLMNTYGVSSGTVQAALNQLAADKTICKIQGKGCFWGNVPMANNVPVVKLSTMEKLSQMFDRDLESGNIKLSQPLPQSKELSIRYDVSQNTLRKFLNDKVESGILTKSGRHYNFKQRDTGRQRSNLSQIVFVTRCNSWGGFTAESERELDFLRYVYKTAGKNQYKLILLGYNADTSALFDRSGNPCRIQDFPNAVGIIISTLLVQTFKPLLEYFVNTKIPVAVWWEHPEENVPRQFIKKDNWVFFNSTFGIKPGLEMGRFLKSRGYTEVNYFSPYHNSSWSIDRMEGLKESGLMVHPFVDSQYASPWDYKEIARKTVEKQNVEMYARNLEKEKLKDLIQQARKSDCVAESIPWVCVNDEIAGLFLEMELPEDIHYIAFDNSAESYLLRLPSYDFNTEALVEHIFYYLSNPDAFYGKKKIHHILGNVVEK
ncbi:GntR family transcriptional regulator [Fibrobacter sp. UWEL]|uniref:GntR family transcriptional regulator n=1 Tax=Fibrobacter sp. UWEL TaxID=1896209 RepID=UPI00091BC01A|nr:GntR family transcriptional regulator [Fibrobacter sp. UWEL]SHL12347.1 DNA-binding transcriptional regulator, LacI/PurR family [Fibrobacter sp. UWEL]